MPSFSREPVYPWDPGLPEKFKNLVDVVEHYRQCEVEMNQIEAELIDFARKIAPIVFLQLRRTIDRDLLFTVETDLVMPDIKRATSKMLGEMSPTMQPLPPTAWTVDIISREIRVFILSQRVIGTDEN
jgi:hypothetical protein